MLIREVLEKSVEQFADITAIKWLSKKEILSETYAQMYEKIKKIRNSLAAKDFHNCHIALIGSSSALWIESYLALITGDNVAVPLDVALPVEELATLINRSDSEGLFLSEKQASYAETFLDSCPKLRKIWILTENKSESSSDSVNNISELMQDKTETIADAKPSPSDLATIIFTSGTTGPSKGVMLTQENIATNVASVEYESHPGTVLLSVLPIHHAYCLVMDWLKGFSLGATLCINDSLLHMVKNMSVFQPEIMLMVPLMLETVYKKLAAADPSIPKELIAGKVFGGKLRIIFTGGAHLDEFYIEKFAEYGVSVLEGYGMSECSPVISSNTPAQHKAGSIGKPLKNVEISFQDGEILVRGSSVMKGYYHMETETSETLKDGWLHTGDKGYLDEDGFLFINGRVKNLIILSNGENVSPEEIENKLSLFPLVGEVVITGENNGLTARIYPDQELLTKSPMTEDEIIAGLQQCIDEYNRTQPGYRHITKLILRKYPFARSTTKKIIRALAEKDEPVSA